jgi:putative ABC transport system permease protein
VPEIAVRVALGALPRQVVALVLGQSLAPIVGGAVIGTLAAIGIGRILVSAIDSVHGLDPAAFGLTIAALGAAAVLATLLPIRRAIRVDPATALRMD